MFLNAKKLKIWKNTLYNAKHDVFLNIESHIKLVHVNIRIIGKARVINREVKFAGITTST